MKKILIISNSKIIKIVRLQQYNVINLYLN